MGLAVLQAFGLDLESYQQYQLWGQYAYLNSGFIMGPAADLQGVLECMQPAGWDAAADRFDDQYALTECMFLHPGNVTVDYAGTLVLSMMGFDQSILRANGSVAYNRATGRPQCFVH